jgi:hypothetical protein
LISRKAGKVETATMASSSRGLDDLSVLLHAIANPKASSIDPVELRHAIGLPPKLDDGTLDLEQLSKDALKTVEDEFLAPVGSIEQDKLWRWQM